MVPIRKIIWNITICSNIESYKVRLIVNKIKVNMKISFQI